MKNKELTVYASNRVVEASYTLSLNELRVLWACVSQINPTQELLATELFELSAKDFSEIFGVSEERAYHALIDVSDSLFNRYLIIDNPLANTPDVKKLKTRWISSVLYLPDKGKVQLCFAQYMLPFLSRLKTEFTKHKLEYIGKMTCTYGIRLYQLLAQWQSIGKREIEIAWLKQQFELDDSYDRMFDLKKRVIEPAVKDINQHSNFTVTWTQRKSGRNVTHLVFQFADKEPNQAVKKTVRKTSKVAQTLTEPSAAIQALIYPQSLSQPERDKCALLLAQIPPQDAQSLLDTLEAAIRAGQVKKSTLALLGGVIKRYHAGNFDASVGMPIAIEREQSAKRQREREINELYGEIKCLERLYAVAKDKSLRTQLQAAQAKLKSYEAMLKTSQT